MSDSHSYGRSGESIRLALSNSFASFSRKSNTSASSVDISSVTYGDGRRTTFLYSEARAEVFENACGPVGMSLKL